MSNSAKRLKLISLLCVSGLLFGCADGAFQSKKIEYKSAGKLPSLEVPPDLTQVSTDERFSVPDINPQASALFSAYNNDRKQPEHAKQTSLLPVQENMTIERAGNQRWLKIKAQPEQVWSVLRTFWQEMGFLIKVEMPEAGIIETDWAENRAKIPQDFIRNTFGKLFDSLYSTAERDKFRARIERSLENPNYVEVYISHRGMYEVIEGGDGGKRTVWEPRPADPELEAEMLQRLMVRFGMTEERAKASVASVIPQQRARLTNNAFTLEIQEPFDRAWRRIGLALDRTGFTVEDRDRSRGFYFVKYVDPEIENQKEGVLSKLAFWKSQKSLAQPNSIFKVQVGDNDAKSGQTIVQVVSAAAQPSTEEQETARRILKLLYEQLK